MEDNLSGNEYWLGIKEQHIAKVMTSEYNNTNESQQAKAKKQKMDKIKKENIIYLYRNMFVRKLDEVDFVKANTKCHNEYSTKKYSDVVE